MVTVSNHGGSCCGARHLYSFDTIVNNGESVDTINTALRKVPVGRRTEVILNGRQVTSAVAPRLLQRLADLGFVLSEHYLNHNHNPARDNFVFTRCDTRRSLTNLPFEWPGQIISAGLTGDLPEIPRTTEEHPVRPNFNINPNLPIEFEDGTPALVTRTLGSRIFVRIEDPARLPISVNGRRVPNPTVFNGNYYWEASGNYGEDETIIRIRNRAAVFNEGDTIRVTNENSRYFNNSGRVLIVSATQLRVRMDVTGEEVVLAKTSCVIISRGVVAPPPVVEPHRHTQEDVAVRTVERAIEVIYHTFHNCYQDGRVGAGYSSLAEAERAAPRARRRLRRDVSSDGTVNDVTL